MCLENTKSIEITEGYGYKFFTPIVGNKSLFPQFGGSSEHPRQHNREYVARREPCSRRMNLHYEPGFHIYLQAPHHRYPNRTQFGLVLKKVKFRNAHTVGYDAFYGYMAVVAERMTILDEEV
jgi:hypothetical protein